MKDIWQGITIGGAGGAIAGITVWVVQYIHTKYLNNLHKKRIYHWLLKKTEDKDGSRYKSTRTIASWTNLTEDRVRYICSIHKKIYLSTGKTENMWSTQDHGDRFVYEDRGPITA